MFEHTSSLRFSPSPLWNDPVLQPIFEKTYIIVGKVDKSLPFLYRKTIPVRQNGAVGSRDGRTNHRAF